MGGLTVQSMQLELSLRISTADDRRTRLRFVAHAAAGMLAGVLLVLFAATDAAAADDLGGLITETVATVEPIAEPVVGVVEPAEPMVEPVVEPIVGQLPPILEPVAPIDSTDPIGSIGPVLDGKLPPLDLPMTDTVPGTPRLKAAVPIDEATPASVDAAIIVESIAVDAASEAPILGAGEVEHALGELGGTFELPSLPSGPPVDAGTAVTFIAALLIGLSMAAPSGWDTNSVLTRLRPIGLTLSPPVPPG